MPSRSNYRLKYLVQSCANETLRQLEVLRKASIAWVYSSGAASFHGRVLFSVTLGPCLSHGSGYPIQPFLADLVAAPHSTVHVGRVSAGNESAFLSQPKTQ